MIDGEIYSWSKHHEFLKFIDLPSRADARFELALGGLDAEEQRLLESHGWGVRAPASLSADIDLYRDYLASSQAEFTVAKDQNVRLRTGWFSDRSATYLAAGRPVITQDTGFGNTLPTGEGLFSFSTIDEASASAEAIQADYKRHVRAASELAREYFAAERVLGPLLDAIDLPTFPPTLVLMPVSRHPTRLPGETARHVLNRPLVPGGRNAVRPDLSVVVVTVDGLPFTRLCLESALDPANGPTLEVVVVDNASTDGTRAYLAELSQLDRRLRVVLNERNRGFPAAVNQGLATARGETLVILNNDVVIPPGALPRLARHLTDASLGLVGPMSNGAATEAEIDPPYTTYGELVEAAAERARAHAGEVTDLPMLTMFCVALRRSVLERVGPLDERFETGLFDDDDYSHRVRDAGLRVVCAEDVLVHHSGQASFGRLVPSGDFGALFEANRRRFESKWGLVWEEHRRRSSEKYLRTVRAIRRVVRESLPEQPPMLVVSKGDDQLVKMCGRRAVHFPRAENGVWAGHYPADSSEAIALLEGERERGARYILFPEPSLWWLDHYADLGSYLEGNSRVAASHDDVCLIFELDGSSDE